jgi:hypothetical protein
MGGFPDSKTTGYDLFDVFFVVSRIDFSHSNADGRMACGTIKLTRDASAINSNTFNRRFS